MNASKLYGALAVYLLMSGSAGADTFVMRDGRSLVGEFLGATARSAHLRTADGVERIAVNKIETIRLDHRPKVTEPEVSSRSDRAAPRAVIVGLGHAQFIEHPRSTH
jgi:hypothetical protein